MENKEIITGRHPVLEYLKALNTGKGSELHLSQKAHGRIIQDILSLARSKGVKVITEPPDYFKKLGPSGTHQGIVLMLSGTEKKAINPGSEEELIKEAVQSEGLILVLDQLTDPHNIGSIARSAEALGATGLVLPKHNSPGLTPVVKKASAGATAHLPVCQVVNLARFLEKAKEAGLWILGSSDRGRISPEEAREFLPAVLVIGSEGSGIRRLTSEKCDHLVRIPLRGSVSSLNASVAAGIIIYEILKGQS